MEFRVDKRTGKEVSLLGFGAMRLAGSGTGVDMDLATELFDYAISNGINYIDTAYLYGNGSGSNEQAVGEIIEKLGCREEIFLSTKMNRMIIKSREDMEEMFSYQLKNLRTSYIDYYFLHNIINVSDVTDLIDMGLLDFIADKKAEGQIVNMGFSFHGSFDDFERILDLYDWDMTIVQYNYLDSNMQACIEGIHLAASRNMSVIIMEPLKGGLLAGNMPREVEKLVENSGTERSNVDLALSWVYDTPEITCVLSGMNSMDMLKENISITSNHLSSPLNNEELDLIADMKNVIVKLNKISCTNCNYCMPCPRNVNIPDIFRLYNEKFLFPENKMFGLNASFMLYAANIMGFSGSARDATLCVDCGLCTSKCPQQLDIPSLIRMVDKSFHARLLRPVIPVVKKLMNIFL